MDSTGGRDDGTLQNSPPPDVLSKSTSQRKTDSVSHRATSGPTLQGRRSYATIARNAPSDERLDGAAGADPATASGQPSRRREHRPANNQITAVPGAPSRGQQAVTERSDASQFDIELDARSRSGQPPSDADSSQSVSVHPISSSKLSNVSASKEARGAQREGATTPGPILSAISVQLTSQIRPVTTSSPSWNVQPSRELQETASNTPLVPPGAEETRERYKTPFAQVDSPRERTVIRPHAEQVGRTASARPSVQPFASSPPPFSSHERNAIRLHAEQVDRTASIRQSDKPPAPPPPPPPFPPPLKRPSASISPLPSPPVPALTKTSSRMQTPRSTLPYEPQAPPRGTPFESPHPPSEDRGKARPDEQGRKDPSASPHMPSAPSEHIPTTTEPLRKGRMDPSATPHRLPAPPEHAPATIEPPPLERNHSSVPHRPSALSERTHATTELPSRHSRKDPSAAQHGPPAPSERIPLTTQQGQEDLSATQRPPAPPKHTPATTELPSRQDRKDPSARPRKVLVPPEHSSDTTGPPLQGHKGPPAVPHGLPIPMEDAPATIDPQGVSGSRRLDRSNSHIQGSEGVDHEAERAVEGPPPERKERKHVLAPKEPRKDSAIVTSSYLKPLQESSVQRRSRENVSSAPYLHDTSDSRGKLERPSNSASHMDSRETLPQSSKGNHGLSPEVNVNQRDVSPAGLQQGPSLNRGYSSQPSLHPGGLDSQERLSRPSTRTSNVPDRTVKTQPARVDPPDPSKNQQAVDRQHDVNRHRLEHEAKNKASIIGLKTSFNPLGDAGVGFS